MTTCAVGGSRFHWAKDCPDKDPETALITDQEADEKTSFLTFVMISGTLFDESKGKAVLDSGCTATVAGEQWLNDYLQTLPQERTIEIKREEVNTFVVFGGGEKVRVKYSITIPVQICRTSCQITVFILPGSLPLLSSAVSMRSAKLIIDFANSSVKLGDSQPVDLEIATSGHLLLDISCRQTDFAFLAAETLSKKNIEKLHKQLAHCSAEKLSSLVKNSGMSDVDTPKIISEVVENCHVCSKFERVKPRPQSAANRCL